MANQEGIEIINKPHQFHCAECNAEQAHGASYEQWRKYQQEKFHALQEEAIYTMQKSFGMHAEETKAQTSPCPT